MGASYSTIKCWLFNTPCESCGDTDSVKSSVLIDRVMLDSAGARCSYSHRYIYCRNKIMCHLDAQPLLISYSDNTEELFDDDTEEKEEKNRLLTTAILDK